MRIVFACVCALLLWVQPVLAAKTLSCRPEAEPSLIPIAEFEALDVETAKKRLRDAVTDIKVYQLGLRSYRNCLKRGIEVMTEQAAAQKVAVDPVKLEQLDNFHNATVAQEQQVVEQFIALRASLCTRGAADYCD